MIENAIAIYVVVSCLVSLIAAWAAGDWEIDHQWVVTFIIVAFLWPVLAGMAFHAWLNK